MQKLMEFASGLKLVIVQNSAVRSVAIGVFVGAGSVFELPEQSGISHFIEHMVFKGTRRRSAFDIVNEIDSIGAQINAYTAKSHTCFYTVSLDTNAEKCLDVLSDLYFEPKFDPKDLSRERKVVLEEINESEDTPDDLCIERLSSVFFSGHPLARPILGTKETLRTLTPADLFEYRAQHYTPANTVVAIAGNISEKKCVELVKKYFENRMEEAGSGGSRAAIEPAVVAGGSAHKKKAIEQAHIAFAFPSVGYGDDRKEAVQLLSVIFGRDMSSRLFQSVRERLGLCYTIYGYPSAYENNGYFVIFTSTNPKKAEAAVKAIGTEIRRLLKDGITPAELKKGKEQLKTSMMLGQENTSSMMQAFGRHAIQTGELYDIDSRFKRIDGRSAGDVLEAARLIFDFDKAAASFVGRQSPDILAMLKED